MYDEKPTANQLKLLFDKGFPIPQDLTKEEARNIISNILQQEQEAREKQHREDVEKRKVLHICYPAGTEVYHEYFGWGIVLEKQDDKNVIVHFSSRQKPMPLDIIHAKIKKGIAPLTTLAYGPKPGEICGECQGIISDKAATLIYASGKRKTFCPTCMEPLKERYPQLTNLIFI